MLTGDRENGTANATTISCRVLGLGVAWTWRAEKMTQRCYVGVRVEGLVKVQLQGLS